jgi:hypothetical protein
VLLQVAVVHVGWLNTAFGTVALTPGQWVTCVAMASSVLWFSELRKWLYRATPRALETQVTPWHRPAGASRSLRPVGEDQHHAAAPR